MTVCAFSVPFVKYCVSTVTVDAVGFVMICDLLVECSKRVPLESKHALSSIPY